LDSSRAATRLWFLQGGNGSQQNGEWPSRRSRGEESLAPRTSLDAAGRPLRTHSPRERLVACPGFSRVAGRSRGSAYSGIIGDSVENSNSTSGQLDLKNDVTWAREGAVSIKLLLVNALALVCFWNTCPSVRLFLYHAQV